MEQLITIRTNILYTKSGEEYTKFNEIILLTEQADYSLNNEGSVIRNRGIKETRFCIASEKLQDVIDYLQSLNDAEEKDLES